MRILAFLVAFTGVGYGVWWQGEAREARKALRTERDAAARNRDSEGQCRMDAMQAQAELRSCQSGVRKL